MGREITIAGGDDEDSEGTSPTCTLGVSPVSKETDV